MKTLGSFAISQCRWDKETYIHSIRENRHKIILRGIAIHGGAEEAGGVLLHETPIATLSA